ncbi:Fructose-1,6-bisphosphatase [Actinidia chinensis var. chinensis]|uniref:Fructose-1,6-bisphosphatase n=1 Tax=Actinidia chinensis var. chinensis TaxID=1590841 RepID=A0A2R6QYJ9_ACTCC|nr:Fructose-1,6-bisphosphatase [Actinidia chinensis var. chinensis]
MDHAADANWTDLMTIIRFFLNEQSKHPESSGDFSILPSHIVLGCKFVCSAVNKGEEQKKLDVLSNEDFIKGLISMAEHASLPLKRTKRQHLLSHLSMEGTVSFLIHWMDPLTMIAVFPLFLGFIR